MSIPNFLIEKLAIQYGEELTKKILEGYSKKRKVTLRVNTIKSNIDEIKNVLNQNNIEIKEYVVELPTKTQGIILTKLTDTEWGNDNTYGIPCVSLQLVTSH